LTGVILLILVAALAGGVCSLARPSFSVETTGETTDYRVDPDSIRRSAALLAVAVASAITLLRREISPRLKRFAGIGLTVALASAAPLWHHAAARVILTPDTITVPLRGGLFPGRPTVLHFADLSDIYFQGERSGNRFQICRTRNNQQIELDCGPLSRIVSDPIETAARAHDVRVQHSF
jgi:hypothetical protein